MDVRMKANPFHLTEKDQSACDEMFGEGIVIDPFRFQTFEVYTGFLEEFYTVLCVHVVAVVEWREWRGSGEWRRETEGEERRREQRRRKKERKGRRKANSIISLLPSPSLAHHKKTPSTHLKLNLKLNCQQQTSGIFPSSSANVNPN
jgi:hypothetical protein